MLRLFAIILTGIITSFYFFPFEFKFLPGVNTKMVMAGISLVILGVQLARKGRSLIDTDFFFLSLLAMGVSLTGLFAVSFNETSDYTYVSYIISMWVWLGGAYVVINCIKWVHGRVSVEMVANYLIGVCVVQCAIAMLIDAYEPVEDFVNTYVAGFDWVELEQLKEGGRLYGIGATLDVSGLRFSAVLVMIAYLCTRFEVKANNIRIVLYLIAFCVITIVGNMLARTTLVGVGLSVICWLFFFKKEGYNKTFVRWLVVIIVLAVILSIYLYNTDTTFRSNIRFAFEGFFSLWEKGEWIMGSNERLKNMYIWPDNFKTWLIGDGYIENPYNREPYYIGPNFGGYYMATDVGYCRFIFYFGLIGLALFMTFFVKATQVCMRRFVEYRFLFLLLLSVNFICWFKVATDIFLVFALFLCVSKDDNDECEVPQNNKIENAKTE